MLNEAVSSESSQIITTDEDGNRVITTVQDEIVEVEDDGTEV